MAGTFIANIGSYAGPIIMLFDLINKQANLSPSTGARIGTCISALFASSIPALTETRTEKKQFINLQWREYINFL